jgi:hypothetical protein
MKRIFFRTLLIMLGLVILIILVFETIGPSVDTGADIDAAAFNFPTQMGLRKG